MSNFNNQNNNRQNNRQSDRHFLKTNSYDQSFDSHSSSGQFHKTRSCDSVSNWRDKSERSNQEKNYPCDKKDNSYHSNRSRNRNNYDGRPLQRQSSVSGDSYDSYSRERYRRRSYERRDHYNKDHSFQEETPSKSLEIDMDDYPELESSNTTTQKTCNEYLQKCMKTKEEQEKRCVIQVKDPKYWRGHQWIGPMFIRSKHSPNIQYSRNDSDWFPSWKDTFTEEEWNLMQRQEEEEDARASGRRLCQLVERDLEEAWTLYYDTGEMNPLLQAHFEGIEYQKYEEKLEEAWNIATEEGNMYSSDNPENYDSDYGSDVSY